MRNAFVGAFLLVLGCGTADENAARPVSPPRSTPSIVAVTRPALPVAPKAPIDLAEYFKINHVVGLTFSSDEKLVAYLSDEGGRQDVWVRPIAGGAATQVTHSEGFVQSFAFSPTQDLLAFVADKGGDEQPHLYLTTSRAKPPKDLVPDLPRGRETQFVRWADDGKTLLFQSSARDEKALDLYEYDVEKGHATLVWKAEGKADFVVASRDAKRFIVSEIHSDGDDDLYLVERSAPEKRTLLTKHTGSVRATAQYFSHDGKKLFLTTDAGGEFTSLVVLDLATLAVTPVRKDDWDVEVAGESHSGRYTFTSANADGSPKLILTDTATGKPVVLPPPPQGGAWDPSDETSNGPFVLGFSKSDRYLAVVLRSDASPAAPYVIDLQEGRAILVVDPRPASLKDRPMVTGALVRIPSFDGKSVPAFLYTPPGDGPFPAVIDVHGGPNWQSQRVFARFRQYLVSKGYVVLAPNVRGSTGYGKTWARLDNLDLGGGPLRDIVACKRYLVDQAHVAAEKVVVMGASYGGYMALAAATFTPDEFAASVDYFGISDMKTLVENFPPSWTKAMGLLVQKWGDPKNPADAAYQHDRSPLYFVDQVTRPLLVVQGENDARVHADQSERMVAALKKRQVPVHYLLLAGEGHGFSKTESYLKAYQMTDRFLDRYLWGDRTVTVD